MEKSGCVSFISANFADLLAISAFKPVLNAKAAEEDAEFAKVMRPKTCRQEPGRYRSRF